MKALIALINGHIRGRYLQLETVCQVLDIPVMQPVPLDQSPGYLAGFWTIGLYFKGKKYVYPLLTVSVSNKDPFYLLLKLLGVRSTMILTVLPGLSKDRPKCERSLFTSSSIGEAIRAFDSFLLMSTTHCVPQQIVTAILLG